MFLILVYALSYVIQNIPEDGDNQVECSGTNDFMAHKSCNKVFLTLMCFVIMYLS